MDPRRQYPHAQPHAHAQAPVQPSQQPGQPYYHHHQHYQQQHHHHHHHHHPAQLPQQQPQPQPQPQQHLQPPQHPQQQPSNPRFSWQIPLSDAERLPIHQLDPAPSSPPPPPQQHPSAQSQAPGRTQSPPQSNRFSYAQTPVEVQLPHFHQNAATRRQTQAEPTVPRSPHSPHSPHASNLNSPMTEFGDMSAISTAAPQLPVPRLSRPLSKEIGEDMGDQGMVPEEYARPMPQEPHPAFFAPVVDTSPRGSIAQPRQRQQSIAQSVAQSDHSHHQQQSQSYDPHPPPASPGPIPIKTESDDNKPAHHAPTSPTSPSQPYSPHSNVPSSRPPIFAPDNPSGPNGMLTAEHKPGQIAHPNMDLTSSGSKHEWKHSLCECSGDVGTCLTGVFCPCVLYGKTGYRLGLKSEKKDPTDMLGWSWANTQCGIMAIASFCGLCGLFPLIHRTRLRHQYHLEGSLASDIVKSCCCCCCSTIQNEREIRDREERANRLAGPSSGATYERPSPMVYEPPPRSSV